MNKISEKEIIDDMVYYLKSRMHFDISVQDYKNVHLFSSAIGLRARELVWLIQNIQNKFSIIFEEQDILNGSCYTFNGIAALVQEKITKKLT